MHQPWRFALLAPSFRYLNGRQCAITRSYAYGLSWMRDCDGRVAVGHGGGLPGFGSNWTIFPSYGIGVMMFDNRTYGGSEAINLAVLDTIIALTELKPRELPPSEILQKRAEQLAAMLPEWKSAEQSGLFAENFFLDNRVSDLVARSKELFAKAGSIKKVKPIIPENQLRGTFVIEGESGNVAVFFTLTPEKVPLIQEVRLREGRR